MAQYGKYWYVVMKLITHNIEGTKHFARVLPFFKAEAADVLCLQEAPTTVVPHLEALGYHVSLALRSRRIEPEGEFSDGPLIATFRPHTATNHTYYNTGEDVPLEDMSSEYIATHGRNHTNSVLLHAHLTYTGDEYDIISTHFTWAPNGNIASPAQRTDLAALLTYTKKLPPHLLCGDFNIPRGHNELYEKLRTQYEDPIPSTYHSTLDQQFHRKGNDPTLQHLFTDYVVDYIFSQPPYVVSDVRLQFGLSDHAAVITTIKKETTA